MLLLGTVFLVLFLLKMVPRPDTYDRYIETDEPMVGIAAEGNHYYDDEFGPLP